MVLAGDCLIRDRQVEPGVPGAGLAEANQLGVELDARMGIGGEVKQDLDVVGGLRACEGILDSQAAVFQFEAAAMDQGTIAVVGGLGEGLVVGGNVEGASAAADPKGTPHLGLVAVVHGRGRVSGGSALAQALGAGLVGGGAGVDDDALAGVGHFERQGVGMRVAGLVVGAYGGGVEKGYRFAGLETDITALAERRRCGRDTQAGSIGFELARFGGDSEARTQA